MMVRMSAQNFPESALLGEINITLVGYKCAGVVQYKADEETGYFCHDTWGKCTHNTCAFLNAVSSHIKISRQP